MILLFCEWMKKSVGIGIHWTSMSALIGGENLSYQKAVDQFQVDHFISSLQRAGADHCLLTLTHAEQYMAFPNEPLERLLAGRTTKRDLIGEIATGLHERGIRLILYYNHSCNSEDPMWNNSCGYSAGQNGNLDGFAQNICDIVEFTALRYGELLSGWWFDSSSTIDPSGPRNTVSCDMGSWRFPWAKLRKAAKAGSEACAVCFNAGVGSNYLYYPDQDYYAGETVVLDEVFEPEEKQGIVSHRWICMDNVDWVFDTQSARRGFADPRFTTEDVTRFVRNNIMNGRMTTFNMEVDQLGRINPKSLSQFAEMKDRINAYGLSGSSR